MFNYISRLATSSTISNLPVTSNSSPMPNTTSMPTSRMILNSTSMSTSRMMLNTTRKVSAAWIDNYPQWLLIILCSIFILMNN
jgi:hypothetical protein